MALDRGEDPLKECTEQMEKEYNNLLYQQYILKKHGNLSFDEQNKMTAEDREIFIKFIKDDIDREREEYEKRSKK